MNEYKFMKGYINAAKVDRAVKKAVSSLELFPQNVQVRHLKQRDKRKYRRMLRNFNKNLTKVFVE